MCASKRKINVIKSLMLISLIFILTASSLAGDKRPLTHDDYDSWKSINGSKISTNGKWICYLETPQDGDAFLVVKNVEKGTEYRFQIGYSGEGTDSEKEAKPQFTFNTSHVVFMISPDKTTVDSLKKKKKKKKEDKPKKNLAILNLADGKITKIDSVKSFRIPEEAGGFLAYLKEAPPDSNKKKKDDKEESEKKKEEKSEKEDEKKKKDKKKKDGTQLVLLNLVNYTDSVFEFVTEYQFTKNAKYLLYIVSNKKKPETDGIYSFLIESAETYPLLTGKGNYKKWIMNKNENYLGFLTDRDDHEAENPTFNLYGWKVGNKKANLWISHTSTKGIPDGMAVSDKSNLTFSEDGKVVMFGIKEIPEPKKENEDSLVIEEAKFDLWHWDDPYPQPQQKKMAKKVRDNTWESVYFIKSKKFVKLADEDLPDVQLSRNGKLAYANNNWPYTKRVAYDGTYADVFFIIPKTGERTLVKKDLYGRANISPKTKYLYWFENKNWFVYNIETKTTTNVTGSLNIHFERHDWDRPNPPGSYGIAGWTNNDKSFLINDRYDIWEIAPDGSKARRITEGFGRENNLSFRYVKLDPDEYSIDPDKPMLLRTINEETMASGFYRDRVNGDDLPEKLKMANKTFGYRQTKAKEANVLLYTRSSFDEYPDLWVSDLEFQNPQKITNLGLQMEPFIWGKAGLIDFKSADGKPLKGILIKPDNFDPEKKYPLMVYIYETLHQGLHRYRNPSPGSSVNPPYYVSNGYILWMPDIEYDTGYPGKDALKCVLPGIQMLVRKGFIDEETIGIQGHSWGGYQIAYMVTQTNIFKAAEAGAPVSNMTSAYGGIRWGSGMVRQFQYERTQSRQGGSLWEVPLRYIENSPLFWADKVETPIMMMHNDEDGAVPWYQGIEFIMALRRLEKEAYMFNYNGEKHGLRKRVNQKDWTIRMAEFFDFHLKGAPAPQWMTDGIKAWEKKEEEKKEEE
jgi:dienelactone hydrolase